jgi:16S rRNA processing protein RimM
MSEERVLLGVFGAAHGVRGEVRVKSYTADPSAIASYRPLNGEDGEAIDIVSARPLKDDMLVVRVKGVGDRSAAERLNGRRIYAPRAALGAVEEDEFFHADLIGLVAETADGEALGRVTGVYDFGAGDLLEVAPERGAPRLFPFTKAVVPRVDLAGGRVVIEPPPEVEAGDGRNAG